MEEMFILASRLGVGMFLAVSALSKALNFAWFVKTLGRYHLAPESLRRPIACLTIGAESTCGVMLTVGIATTLASYAAFVLLSMFTIAVVINLIRGRYDLECGCSGFGKGTRIGWILVCRNGGLACLAVCPAWYVLSPMLVGLGVLLLGVYAVLSRTAHPETQATVAQVT